jgi:hypothetical protein
MDAHSPLQYLGGSLQQVAFVVKDLTAGMEFFGRTMGVPRFYVIEDFGLKARDKTFRGRPGAKFQARARLFRRHANRAHPTPLRRHLLQGAPGTQGRRPPPSRLFSLRSPGVPARPGFARRRRLFAADERTVRHHTLHLFRYRGGDRFDNGDRLPRFRRPGLHGQDKKWRLLARFEGDEC